MVSCGLRGSSFYVGSSCPAKAAWMELGEAINLRSVSAKFTNSVLNLLQSSAAGRHEPIKARADHPLKETIAVQALNCGFYTAELTWNKCRSIISESLDECFVGLWVFAQSATGPTATISGRISDILTNHTGTAIVVLEMFQVLSARDPLYGMPVLVRHDGETTFTILPGKVWKIAAEYVAEVKDINQNIKAMFEKQADDARVPWDQEHFEDLVAKWVAACDQPFTAVITDEFREMLEYTHHHSPKPLNIPSDESVKKRITRMSQEMVDGLKQIFKIPGVLTLAITTEESLIDFRELIGQH
ncbi:hypothetical protein B0H14DRAFT_2559509 [Mycena olivaceomarginata]|nr:hypothetical protein B0H14DRAFT_2559509 [Mycena olivaceomarginata]